MTETIRLLERLKIKDQYRDLEFFRDWTVHAELTRSRAGKAIIAEMDKVIHEVASTQSFAPMTAHLKGVVSLELLSDELRKVFTSNNLPTKQLDNAGWWAAFVVLYINVVHDCPLQLGDGYRLTVNHIDAAKFFAKPNHDTVIVTKWVLTKDGKEIGTILNEGYVERVTTTWTYDSAGNLLSKSESP